LSRHICFQCEGRHAEFCASSRFTTLFWDDALGILQRHGVENPFRPLADDARASGSDLHRWLEDVIAGLAAPRETLPALYQIWRVHDDGETWGSDAGYFVWRGVPHMVDSVYDALIVHPLDDAEWHARLPYLPYAPPVLEDVRPPIVPAETTDRDGRPMHTLSAAEFERLFQGTPLHLEHGGFVDFLRTEIDEARAAARHAAEGGEQVVFYSY
jgi:hypothetical protein